MGGMLSGKSVIVTGGAQGIGQAIARRVVDEGGRVLIADVVDEAVGRDLADLGDAAHYVHCDVGIATDVSAAVAQAAERFGSVDGLVNNAAVGITGPLLQLTEAQFDKTVDVNLKGAFLFLQNALQQMSVQGRGSIVNIASVGGLVGTPEFVLYSMSKHGVIGITKSAALEFAGQGIRINAVCPGPVWTPMMEDTARQRYGTDDPAEIASIQRIPRGMLGTPEDVAELTVWLLSDRSANCTGAAFVTDGGYTAQ